jgi:hypothetical protein
MSAAVISPHVVPRISRWQCVRMTIDNTKDEQAKEEKEGVSNDGDQAQHNMSQHKLAT